MQIGKARVVWRHPLGRFDVIETYHRAMDGSTYMVRTCKLTPQRDARGRCSEVDFIEPIKPVEPEEKRKHIVTPEDVTRWKALHNDGLTFREIAKQTGFSEVTVSVQVRGVNYATGRKDRARWTEEENKQMLRLYRERLTTREIAKVMGRSVCTVRLHLREAVK